MIYTVVVTDDANNYAGTIIIQATANPDVAAQMFQDQLERLYTEIQAEDNDYILRDLVVSIDETLTNVKKTIGDVYGIAQGYRRERPEGLVLDVRQGCVSDPVVESQKDSD